MFDLLIKGGYVVTPLGSANLDIGIQGEKIAAISDPNQLPEQGARIVDASGKLVIPGGVEPHAHAGDSMTPERAPAREVSLAAIWGGTTTVMDFAQMPPETDLIQAIEISKERWVQNAYTDYSFHPIIRGGASADVIAQIGQTIANGFATIKIFTTSIRPPLGPRPSNFIDFGRLGEIMTEVEAQGGMMFIHAEDEDEVMYNYHMAESRNQLEWHNMHLIHNNISEDLSFRRVIRLAESKGVAVYFVHVSAKEGVNAVAEARQQNLPIYGETLHNYVSFNAENYKEENGMKYHTYPSLKSEDDRLKLWEGLLNGDLSTIATDVVATSWEEKIKYRTVRDVTGGHNGIETRIGIMYTEGVIKRGMSLQRWVELCATNPAKLVGIYPRKGVIKVGSDADICIFDTSFKRRISMEDLHLNDYSIWDGWEVQGWPVTTVLRGKLMIEDRELLGNPSDGRLLPRKMDPATLAQPIC